MPYRPYLGGPFRWRLGLRPLDLRDWIEIDERYDADIAAKLDVLERYRDTVFVALDDIEPEATEVLDALVTHLRARFPDRFADVEVDRLLHPLDAAGRLVQEDLAILVERGGRLVFGGGSICFPNRWDLRSKLGLPLSAVHAPVSRLNEQLQEPIDRFFARLTPERGFWRLGWGVLDTDDRYQPLDGTAAPRPASPTPADLHLRVERETLRRFPETNCVLFTIRTYVAPLSSLAEDPAEGCRLAEAIEALPDDVADYKQLDAIGAAAADLLRGRTG
jgi:dimethylamine monooxygenase subunit A